ncbi:sulfite exporter TauE/SafE family protein [Parablastomonas sp. CN1-191]|uniref:sulfite exporter TauE/SafE family protein n=1 Tax=Parablastomonas sp. CN1-191 TaxID=3400908 RepID=UPI003BF7D5B2
MTVDAVHYGLAVFSGGLVGFVLGLVGGGGSILAVPLMVYLVGVRDPHMAIGTSALAVAVNAASGLVSHWRAGTVKWRCAAVFAASGIAGAALGSTLGKALDGQKLLALFAVVMIVVGVVMLRRRGAAGDPEVRLGRENAGKLVGYGAGAGLFSGFFGIGGGFLIVPGLIAATGMPMLNAVGSSLIAVTAFGVTTAANYALSGLVDWPLALAFIAGGLGGSVLGSMAARGLSQHKGRLTLVFAVLIFAVAAYVLWRSARAM